MSQNGPQNSDKLVDLMALILFPGVHVCTLAAVLNPLVRRQMRANRSFVSMKSIVFSILV